MQIKKNGNSVRKFLFNRVIWRRGNMYGILLNPLQLFTYTVDNHIVTCRTYNINPISHLKRLYHRIRYNVVFLYLKYNDRIYMQCEGCGEGISKFRIKDPNNKKKRLNCCANCVDFYNFSLGAFKMIDWKNNKNTGR